MTDLKDDVLAALDKGFGPRRLGPAGDRKALRHRRQRRQGVFVDHGRRRRSPGLGSGARTRRGGDPCRAGRQIGDGGADRRAVTGSWRAPRRGRRSARKRHRTRRIPMARDPVRRSALPRRRRRPASPASPRSLRWPPAKAASANRPPRSIWRSACAISGSKSAFSMPTSTAPRCQSFSPSASGRRR